MGASRAGSAAGRAADLTAGASLPASSPAAVLEFAVQRLLQGAAPDALAAVLQRLAEAFSGRAALAVQYRADRTMVVFAAYPEQAARDPALLAMIQADDPPASLLLASPPDGDRSLCTLVLAGDSPAWTA